MYTSRNSAWDSVRGAGKDIHNAVSRSRHGAEHWGRLLRIGKLHRLISASLLNVGDGDHLADGRPTLPLNRSRLPARA
ncbi:hypothetical protein [Kitasatospora cathayae]|uniref:Tn3 transposase DDE domain-containing protein n=1 Tax=Kitasatospora cathayae TaxID=3004092 RepID=A0ABY7Q489_9ACTN|nr:hypothetical protein [Kitasatospora sp. HUAS 3-15]WBP87051.1 hypothetical protein O1G21_15155 [Kitasatospora sp. HUAS 3-15]